jgi:hypothetical protein
MHAQRINVKRLLSAVLLLALAISGTALQKEPIPQYPGDENPRHDGQPSFCQNHDSAKHAKNCSCRSMNPDGETCSHDQESASCKVYCRRKACRCANPCAT